MTARNVLNLLFVALIAAFCFGGSFTCNTNDDDEDGIRGNVSINARTG